MAHNSFLQYVFHYAAEIFEGGHGLEVEESVCSVLQLAKEPIL